MSVVIAAACGAPGERARVRLEADLADGAEALDRLELGEHVHRLHRDRETDPVGDARGEALDVRGLAAGDAAVVRIEEADEPHAGAPGGGGCDATPRRCHGG